MTAAAKRKNSFAANGAPETGASVFFEKRKWPVQLFWEENRRNDKARCMQLQRMCLSGALSDSLAVVCEKSC